MLLGEDRWWWWRMQGPIIFCDDVHFNICSLNTKLRLSIGERRRRQVAKGKAMWKENAKNKLVTSDICIIHSKQLFMR